MPTAETPGSGGWPCQRATLVCGNLYGGRYTLQGVRAALRRERDLRKFSRRRATGKDTRGAAKQPSGAGDIAASAGAAQSRAKRPRHSPLEFRSVGESVAAQHQRRGDPAADALPNGVLLAIQQTPGDERGAESLKRSVSHEQRRSVPVRKAIGSSWCWSSNLAALSATSSECYPGASHWHQQPRGAALDVFTKSDKHTEAVRYRDRQDAAPDQRAVGECLDAISFEQRGTGGIAVTGRRKGARR